LGELDISLRLTELERENRKLRRTNTHLQNAIAQEKIAYTTVLNQQKASTFIQRERERYLALLLANSPSIILFISEAWRIEFCTKYFVQKAGFDSVSDILGRALTEVLPSLLDTETFRELLEQINHVTQMNAPQAFDATFCFDKKDGEIEDFSGLLVPMKDDKHNSNGVMLMFHDVTDLKRSREEALSASRAKSDFLSNMSHEIRTPMNAIIGMTSIGKHEKNLERKDYAFEKIESASIHLLGVINDILDISKIESGKMELSPIAFRFSQMLDRVMSVITQRIQDKGQKLTVQIAPSIPDALLGDDQRLAQVITNIVSNAIKFTPEEGDITFSAKVLDLQTNKCVLQMSVKDTGIGMTKQEQSKLFVAFQQAQVGTSRKYGGSGLGLAISKRILELMDGNIWVESEMGKGSCFYFTASLGIPSLNEVAAGQDATNDSDYEDITHMDLTGKVIMLADDIEINQEIIIALLEPTNITIETANNGREAIDVFVSNPNRYDLILMDMQMPEVDGLEATRAIRELGTPKASTIPIIAMTANVFKEDMEKCLKAGMNGHLGKPIVIKDMMSILSQYLKS